MKRLLGGLGLVALGLGGCASDIDERTVSNAQAVIGSWSAEDNLTLSMVDYERKFPASCVIRENDVDKVLVAGGYDSDGDATADVFLWDPSAGSQWEKVQSMNTARGEAKMVTIPGTDKCVIVGGKSSQTGASLDTAEEFDLSNYRANNSNGWSSAGTLDDARADFQLSVCGTYEGVDSETPAHLIAVGGLNGSNYLDSIEVYDANSKTWSTLTTMTDARAAFALAPLVADPSGANRFKDFLIAGGFGGSDRLATLELLVVTDACMLTRRIHCGTNSMVVGRSEMEANFEGTANTFIVPGGTTNGTDATDTTEKITINDWTNCDDEGDVTIATISSGGQTLPGGPSMPTARRRYGITRFANNASRFMYVGGIVNNGETNNQSSVFNTSSKAWESVDGLSSHDLLTPSTGRYAAAVEWIPSAAKVGAALGAQRVLDSGIIETTLNTSELSP